MADNQRLPDLGPMPRSPELRSRDLPDATVIACLREARQWVGGYRMRDVKDIRHQLVATKNYFRALESSEELVVVCARVRLFADRNLGRSSTNCGLIKN